MAKKSPATPSKEPTTKPNDFKLSDFGKGKQARAEKNNPIKEYVVETEDSRSDNKEKNGHISLTQWTKVAYNAYIATSKTYKKLPDGFYNLSSQNGIPIFSYRELNVDELISFPNSSYETIIQEIKQFWTKKEIFDQYGFLHRRGYLLYGPQGSGKSCMSQLVIKDIIEREGIVINCNCSPSLVDRALVHLREVEPDRKVVCLFEDIDAIIHVYGEDSLLSLLDGENQINTVLNLATTNYPENLDKRIVSRPRRFDRVLKIGMPNAVTRRLYFEKKLNIPTEELNKWVKASAGFSFAALAELVISVKCFENPFAQAVENLKELLESRHHSDTFNKKNIGFAGSVDTDDEDDDNDYLKDAEAEDSGTYTGSKVPNIERIKKVLKKIDSAMNSSKGRNHYRLDGGKKKM